MGGARGRAARMSRMAMLVYVYDVRLVLASIAISMMAAFTGLALTRGLAAVSEPVRQLRIVMAAIALGGGIWSMHFVAMLAMRFNVVVYYKLLPTVASVLIAILLACLALLLVHFGPRTAIRKAASGATLGVGIVTMHYVGLSAIEGCAPDYAWGGVLAALVLAVVMGSLAMRVAYGQRTQRNILLATVIFGSSVAIVHFTAMHWTDFHLVSALPESTPRMDNAQLALAVLISAFVICGAFLMSGASFLSGPQVRAGRQPRQVPAVPVDEAAPGVVPGLRLPYERDGVTYFLDSGDVAAIRAEGHYTIAYARAGRVFCPWSISQAEARLGDTAFFRAHRSYLVNTAHVCAFERRKDNGICLFRNFPQLDKVPVSRSRVAALQDRLGL